jgi:hypothetical protein
MKQLDLLSSRHRQATEKKSKALKCLLQLRDKEAIYMQTSLDLEGGCVPLKLSEYYELQNLKVKTYYSLHQKVQKHVVIRFDG